MLTSRLLRRVRVPIATASFAAASFAAASSLTTCEPSKVPKRCLQEADTLFENNQYDQLMLVLRSTLARAPDDAELLWRLGRVCKKQADGKAKPEREALTREGYSFAERAITADVDCGPCHKWYAILLSGTGEFNGTSAKIKDSFRVREHFERAVALSPADATSRHLLGLWCFEVGAWGFSPRAPCSAGA